MVPTRFVPPPPPSTDRPRGRHLSRLTSIPGCPQSRARLGTVRLLHHLGAIGQLTAPTGQPAQAGFEALEPELESLKLALARPTRGH
jgi:hypothetical protein